MKTLCFKAGISVLLLLAVMKTQAQIVNPYPVQNNTNCYIRIFYEISKGAECDLSCGGTILLLPPGQTTLIHFPEECGCKIKICIRRVGDTDVTPEICAIWPPTPVNIGPDPSGCSFTGGITISVMQTGTVIQP